MKDNFARLVLYMIKRPAPKPSDLQPDCDTRSSSTNKRWSAKMKSNSLSIVQDMWSRKWTSPSRNQKAENPASWLNEWKVIFTCQKGEFIFHNSTKSETEAGCLTFGVQDRYRISKEKVLPSCFESLRRMAHMRVGLQCGAKRCPNRIPILLTDRINTTRRKLWCHARTS